MTAVYVEKTWSNAVVEYFHTKPEAEARAREIETERSPFVYMTQNHAWMDDGRVYWAVTYHPRSPFANRN